jgi:putative peptide zinc metalloprotease protein
LIWAALIVGLTTKEGKTASTPTRARRRAQARAARESVWERLRERISPADYTPVLRSDLTWVRTKTRHGDPYLMVADRGHVYIRLEPEDEFLASRMDGTRRIADLVVDYFHQFGSFGYDRVVRLVGELRDAGLLTDPPRDIYAQLHDRLHPPARPVKPRRTEGTFLMLRVPLHGIDGFVSWLYDHVGFVFFKRPVLLLTVVIAVLGLAAFIADLLGGHDLFAPLGSSVLLGVVALVVAYYVATAIHESAHALTAKHFGRRVDQGGFMLFYLMPAFYVDVTDVWLDTWWRRIAVSWAGPYSGFTVAGACSILVFLFPHGGIATTLLFKFAVASYFTDALNLMPLLPLDGYYILMDWLEIPQLRQRALEFIRGPMWRMLLDRERFTRREVLFGVFGVLAATYSSLSIFLAVLYWRRRLSPVVTPLWATPGFWAKATVVVVIAAIAIPLGMRLGRRAWRYVSMLRKAPAAAKALVVTVRLRDRVRLLESLGFLATLPLVGLDRLARAARVREVPRGTNVVRQGERGNEFFVVAAGQAVVIVRERGEDKIVEELGVGGYFGERALLGDGLRRATVRAVTPLKLLAFPTDAFWKELAGTMAWETRLRMALGERERLEELPIFASMGSRQLDLLAVKLEVRDVAAGETLIRQGDPGDTFYIVREGELEVLVSGNGGRRRANLLQPGDFFGEIALLYQVPRTATVRARTPASVWELGRQDFRDLLGRYMGLEDEVAKLAASRWRRRSRARGVA